MATENDQNNGEYNAEDLEHLSDLEHVRERPSMYIGDTTARGLHHLVYEVVDNSIDEAMADFASEVLVSVNVDGSVTSKTMAAAFRSSAMSSFPSRWTAKCPRSKA